MHNRILGESALTGQDQFPSATIKMNYIHKAYQRMQATRLKLYKLIELNELVCSRFSENKCFQEAGSQLCLGQENIKVMDKSWPV